MSGIGLISKLGVLSNFCVPYLLSVLELQLRHQDLVLPEYENVRSLEMKVLLSASPHSSLNGIQYLGAVFALFALISSTSLRTLRDKIPSHVITKNRTQNKALTWPESFTCSPGDPVDPVGPGSPSTPERPARPRNPGEPGGPGEPW